MSPGPRIGRSEVGQSPRASTATEGVDRVAGCSGACCYCEERCSFSRTNHKGFCACSIHRQSKRNPAIYEGSITEDYYAKNPAAVALGSIKTPKKAAASRRNGRLGGAKPKKVKEIKP
jgi:hypothetical protein